MGASSIEIPVFWLEAAGQLILLALVCYMLIAHFKKDRWPLGVLQNLFGPSVSKTVRFFLLFVIFLFWVVLFLLLFYGLVSLIYSILSEGLPTEPVEKTNWRFALTKLVALTGVLGAVVALPFTLVRIGLTRQQVNTAKEALLNDKIDVAVSDLYAQRQITVKEGEAYHDIWEDDIIRRNGAIDRLQGLVTEEKTLSPRVIRLLSLYVRELSRKGAKAQKVPEGLEGHALRDWARGLRVQRSDMEKAVQTLGRLPVVEDDQGRTTRPDLTGANLQAMDLSGLDFRKVQLRGAQLQGADLAGVQLQGADLFQAELQGADLLWAELQGAKLSRAELRGANLLRAKFQGAYLTGVQLQGAYLAGGEFDSDTGLHAATLRGAACRFVDFTAVPQIADHLEHLFGDATVKLPPGVTAPARFSQTYDTEEAFHTAWEAFQRSIGQDPYMPT